MNHGPEPARFGPFRPAWPPSAARLAADPLRPQFHLLPKYGWMNDPNAPVFWKGKYHMFFQYNPGAAVWGDMHWAHAVSPDMVHWQHLPVALAPTPGSYDADGCFTGSFVDDNGTAAIIYTGVQSVTDMKDATLRDGTHNFRETQALATTADPMLRTWNKLPEPVIARPPAGLDVTGFRDPSIWKQDGWYYMTVGSGTKAGGMVLLYRSPGSGPKALRSWEYLHPVFHGEANGNNATDPVDSGQMWECPELFPVGDLHVLIYSTERKVYWVSGRLDPKTMLFSKQQQGLLDGGAFYAPKTQLDAHGNRILWGWIQEKRDDAALKQAGWAGCISLPRVLTVDSRGILNMTPAPAVQQLRGARIAAAPVAAGSPLRTLNLPAGPRAEIHAVLSGSDAVVELLDSAEGSPWFSVAATAVGQSLVLRAGDQSVTMPASDEVELRIFVDASVVEVFANGVGCLTARVYRTATHGLRVQTGGEAAVTVLEAWPVRPVSSDRLTT
jgi:beta-fructofuranosidase